jgi:hypothetical protein
MKDTTWTCDLKILHRAGRNIRFGRSWANESDEHGTAAGQPVVLTESSFRTSTDEFHTQFTPWCRQSQGGYYMGM